MKASLLDVNDINRLFHMVRILLLRITLSKLYPRQGLQTPSLIIFSWLRMALCRNIEGFLSILKEKKYCALVRCVNTREFLTTRFRRGNVQDTQVLLSYHNLRRVSVFHVPVLMTRVECFKARKALSRYCANNL